MFQEFNNFIFLSRMILILFLGFSIGFVFNGCKSISETDIKKPTDYTSIIEETKEVLKDSAYPENYRLKKVLSSLEDCNNYSNSIYDKYLILVKSNEGLKKEIESYQLEIKKLESELTTYRKIKIFAYVTIGIVVFAILWKILSPILLPMIKKMLGVPF